jgi:vancomycin aglycone glucosyltransferase
MDILLSTVGTRGDAQPVMALALAAREAGHGVRLCLPPNFLGWAAELGFEARPLGIEMRAPRPGERPAPPPSASDLIADQFATLEAAARGCDLILGAGAHQYAARSVAEAGDLPFVLAVYAPVALPSPDHAPPGRPDAGLGAGANLRLWDEHKAAWNARSLDRVNAGRASLGLAPIGDVLTHILGERPWLAADPVLGPTAGPDIVQTGVWLLADETPLPPDVEAFLQAGEPPVYLGLGSMPSAPETGRALVEAARAAGRRAILSQGWAELAADAAPDVLCVGDLNHQALFPRVAAVLHHGGAGTTTAAALAGVPQVIAPLFGDQFYWAGRVQALGLGSAAASPDPGDLVQALARALSPAVADAAAALSKRIATDGAAAAVRRLEAAAR